jgi:hypothetical protein
MHFSVALYFAHLERLLEKSTVWAADFKTSSGSSTCFSFFSLAALAEINKK